MQSISNAIGNLKIVNSYFYENRNGLVLDLRFDERQGSIAHDSSGNGNDGTLNLGSNGNTDPNEAWVDGVRLSTFYNHLLEINQKV